MPNAVIDIPAAPAPEAEAHFAASFRFETDCWDVHDALSRPDPGFVLIDVRGPDLFAKGHVPGAINLPHGKIIASKLAAWPEDSRGDPGISIAYERCVCGADWAVGGFSADNLKAADAQARQSCSSTTKQEQLRKRLLL